MCVIVVGEGYPDFATQTLLNVLQNGFRVGKRRVPILIATDADPHGMDIAALYQFGSASRVGGQRGVCEPDELDAVEWRRSGEGRHWVGLWPEQAQNLELDRKVFLPLTRRDRGLIASLDRNVALMKNPLYARQIQVMLAMNSKLELESLKCLGEGGLSEKILNPAIEKALEHHHSLDGSWIANEDEDNRAKRLS